MSMFTRQDLGALLGEDEHGGPPINDKIDEIKDFKPKLDPSKKVLRYRPGQVPEWIQKESEEEAEQDQTANQTQVFVDTADLSSDEEDRPSKSKVAEIVEASDSDSDSAAPVTTTADEEDTDDDIEARRARARARILARRRQESEDDDAHDESATASTAKLDSIAIGVNAAPSISLRALAPDKPSPALSQHVPDKNLQQIDSDEEANVPRRRPQHDTEDTEQKAAAAQAEAASSSSEYDTSSDEDTDDEFETRRALVKPVFRRKDERDTIKEQEQKERLEEERLEEQKLEVERRKQESRKLVAAEVEKDAQEAQSDADEDPTKPDDADDSDDEEFEFNAWRVREIKRIKRDREERAAREAEKAETERRRNLTAEEREAEDRELARQGIKIFDKQKKSIGFMQKYYHKGVFYMDDESLAPDDVRRRTADGATGADKVNKSVLPSVLQVRGDQFGKRSRSKWTHLVNEDTTIRKNTGPKYSLTGNSETPDYAPTTSNVPDYTINSHISPHVVAAQHHKQDTTETHTKDTSNVKISDTHVEERSNEHFNQSEKKDDHHKRHEHDNDQYISPVTSHHDKKTDRFQPRSRHEKVNEQESKNKDKEERKHCSSSRDHVYSYRSHDDRDRRHRSTSRHHDRHYRSHDTRDRSLSDSSHHRSSRHTSSRRRHDSRRQQDDEKSSHRDDSPSHRSSRYTSSRRRQDDRSTSRSRNHRTRDRSRSDSPHYRTRDRGRSDSPHYRSSRHARRRRQDDERSPSRNRRHSDKELENDMKRDSTRYEKSDYSGQRVSTGKRMSSEIQNQAPYKKFKSSLVSTATGMVQMAGVKGDLDEAGRVVRGKRRREIQRMQQHAEMSRSEGGRRR